MWSNAMGPGVGRGLLVSPGKFKSSMFRGKLNTEVGRGNTGPRNWTILQVQARVKTRTFRDLRRLRPQC
jgi:hypothetical protein